MSPVTPLKVAIVASGRTQRELAATVDITEEWMSRIANGANAGEPLRLAIAEELGVPVESLWPYEEA
jgi:DNA-binding XRE family transcriptional regulator